MANCAICKKNVGPAVANAKIYHLACAVEEVYARHNRDPSTDCYAEDYKQACLKREQQIKGE